MPDDSRSALRRVVVTGIGTVSALGAGGAPALAAALAAGRSAIAPVRSFDAAGSPSRLAAEVDEAMLTELVDPDAARRLSRICRLAVAASGQAMADARLDPGDGARLGLAIGTEHGDFRSSEAFAAGYLRRGVGGLSPMIFPNTVMNSMGAVAAIALGARGPTITVNQATIAGDLAVARGAALVAGGRATAVVAGGVDELCAPVYRRLAEMRVLSPMGGSAPEGCRPFAPDHNGPVIGEGATFVVLEERAAALARGATVHAELLGVHGSSIPVAPHTAPSRRRDPHSPVTRVLGEAGVDAGALSLCYGAGNGDPGIDDWEMALLETDLAAGLPSGSAAPCSLAPLFGQHGGLGALRVAAAALALAGAAGPALVHGIARGGCRTAILLGRAA